MALFLVQHGLSQSKDIDPSKGLSSHGKAETKLIGEVAHNYSIEVSSIVHSGKKRAAQTAALFQEALSLDEPPKTIEGIAPLDDVDIFAKNIRPESNLMVVGHLPFLQRLVSLLTTGDKDIKVYQFQNSGIVCLDCSKEPDGSFNWFIKWTLNPHIS